MKPFILTPWERDHLPAMVLKVLKEHVGHRFAITGQGLAAALGHRDDRKIRLAIRELIREGQPIASSVGGSAMGFYVCSSGHEAMAYISTLRARAKEDLTRLKDFEEAAAKKFSIPRQESLF
jgi:hypothetical protein